jgi:MFS family permease
LLGIIGIGFVAIQITAYSILAEIVPKERLGEFMGVMNFFISLGQFITNIAMGYIIKQIGYIALFPVASLLMFIAVAIILRSKFKKDFEPAKEVASEW